MFPPRLLGPKELCKGRKVEELENPLSWSSEELLVLVEQEREPDLWLGLELGWW